jgi:hypothetical protein
MWTMLGVARERRRGKLMKRGVKERVAMIEASNPREWNTDERYKRRRQHCRITLMYDAEDDT